MTTKIWRRTVNWQRIVSIISWTKDCSTPGFKSLYRNKKTPATDQGVNYVFMNDWSNGTTAIRPAAPPKLITNCYIWMAAGQTRLKKYTWSEETGVRTSSYSPRTRSIKACRLVTNVTPYVITPSTISGLDWKEDAGWLIQLRYNYRWKSRLCH